MSTEAEIEAAFREAVEGKVAILPAGRIDAHLRAFSRILAVLRSEAGSSVDDEKLVALADARAAALLRGE